LASFLQSFKDDLSSKKHVATQEKGQAEDSTEASTSLLFKAQALLGSFKPVYWQALAVIVVLYFARFDASFLLLRAKQVMPKTEIASILGLNMAVQAFMTAPLAKFAGQSVSSRNTMLTLGFLVMIAADAAFGLPFFAHRWGMWLGATFLALHMSMTHSITLSMVGSYMPTGEVKGIGKLSGTAWSLTDILLGFALVASNYVAGVLSDVTAARGWGNVGCFAGGATACLLAILLLNVFARFGDLEKQELVVKRKRGK